MTVEELEKKIMFEHVYRACMEVECAISYGCQELETVLTVLQSIYSGETE